MDSISSKNSNLIQSRVSGYGYPSDKVLSGKRILVVDDCPDLNTLICTILTLSGAQVDSAKNATDALVIALNQKHDLLFLDVRLPGMSGYAVSSSLRKGHYLTPIIALSAALDNEKEREKCLLAGCNDYLTKPFEFDDLINMAVRYTNMN